MLLLVFSVGEDLYAIDAGSVVEVLPLLEIRRVRHSPKGIVGTIDYHGTFVAVVDLKALMLDQPVQPRLSTRIILTRSSSAGAPRLLGILASNATDTMRRRPEDFVAPGVVSASAPYLGSFILDGPGNRSVQKIEVDILAAVAIPGMLLPLTA